MKDLSDFQIGYVRRLLDCALTFVPGPAPHGKDNTAPWCRQVCGVDTLGEVAKQWGDCLCELGKAFFTYGLADEVRKGRPVTPRNLLLTDLTKIPEYVHAILCIAVDEAEGEDFSRREEMNAKAGKEASEQGRERASEQVEGACQIFEVLQNMLVMDGDTFQRFLDEMKRRVECWLRASASDSGNGGKQALINASTDERKEHETRTEKGGAMSDDPRIRKLHEQANARKKERQEMIKRSAMSARPYVLLDKIMHYGSTLDTPTNEADRARAFKGLADLVAEFMQSLRDANRESLFDVLQNNGEPSWDCALEFYRLCRDGNTNAAVELLTQAYGGPGWGDLVNAIKFAIPVALKRDCEPIPPPGWEGPYATPVDSIADFAQWLERQILSSENLTGAEDWSEPGSLVVLRNAHRLIDKLGLSGMPPLPSRSVNRHEEVAYLRTLRQECRRRLGRPEPNDSTVDPASAPLRSAPISVSEPVALAARLRSSLEGLRQKHDDLKRRGSPGGPRLSDADLAPLWRLDAQVELVATQLGFARPDAGSPSADLRERGWTRIWYCTTNRGLRLAGRPSWYAGLERLAALAEALAGEVGTQQTGVSDIPPTGDGTASAGLEKPTDDSGSGGRGGALPSARLKEPSKDAFTAYRTWLVTGAKQEELAQQLMVPLKRKVDQGTISRWLKQVTEWITAGNVLPDLPQLQESKPTPMDPERIDLGERQDGRAKHQRGRRNADGDD